MNVGGLGSVQNQVQLTVLRRVLDMASVQAEQMLQNMEEVSPTHVGQVVDVTV